MLATKLATEHATMLATEHATKLATKNTRTQAGRQGHDGTR